MLAIQWHPEELVSGDKAWDRLIFAAFAEEVRRARGDR
jgi:gamma-glutamyl-gamma-aminobutyrate hydrolase PuuD